MAQDDPVEPRWAEAEIDRLRQQNAALVKALEEWWRLDNIKGMDPALRKRMKSYARELTRAALRAAKGGEG